MKNQRTRRLILFVLLFAISLNALTHVEVLAQRERVVPTPALSSKPTLKIKPTPTPKPSPIASPTPTPSPVVSPTPVATSIPASTLTSPKTIDDLQARIHEVLTRPGLARAQVGIKVVSLDSGKVLFEENAEKLYMPASNMKAYTIAAALDRLTPDYHFVTSVYATTKPDANGVIKGNLMIEGGGDPTFAASLNNGDYWKGTNELASRIAAAGVKKIEGDIVGNETFFAGSPLGFGWEWDDLQTYYGAEVSALTINDNAIDIFVKQGAKVGDACFITTGPPLPSSLLQIVNKTVTAQSGTPRRIVVTRKLGQNVVEVSGVVPIDDKRGFTGTVSIGNPALAFVYMLRAALAQKGITITGQSRTINSDDYLDNLLRLAKADPSLLSPNQLPMQAPNGDPRVVVATFQSPPLSEVAAKTMKPSQNLYTEIILRTLGERFGPVQENRDKILSGPKSSAEKGLEVVKQFLREAGIPEGSVEMYDGSGLSRHNLITASATVQLYAYMSRHRYAQAFRDALPIAGVDGTLSGRMKGTPAAGNLRAKTGTINQVAALSGYVTTAAGERLVFSILVNNLPDDSGIRRSYIDEIAVMLASFTGKTQ